ncbi:hypothetical protein [Kutzneria chonburiensis]|uniref:hypothetical protein n=1 Tax=Kutzneria chonburiensis TaxID=1483604 RepID=UPI0023628102|nr:hypothetical protein [Kutzneria chonburiensis]
MQLDQDVSGPDAVERDRLAAPDADAVHQPGVLGAFGVRRAQQDDSDHAAFSLRRRRLTTRLLLPSKLDQSNFGKVDRSWAVSVKIPDWWEVSSDAWSVRAGCGSMRVWLSTP